MARRQAVVVIVAGLGAGLALVELAGCVIVQTIPREERAPVAAIPAPAPRIIIEQRPAVPAPRGS